MKQSNINVNVMNDGKELVHFWSKCVGAGRAGEGLRADWQAQLKKAVDECGFEYIRFHGLLAEDMGVAHLRADGTYIFQFQYIDTLFDALLDIGIKPFVEFGFTPKVMATGEKTCFWWKANVTPPKDISKWGELVGALVAHWKERYGLDEIRTWYYEIWNEADLSGFWTGTKSEYFEMYRAAVTEIKAVDSELKVGGPATSNFVPDDRFHGEKEDISKQITHLYEDLDSLNWEAVWVADFLKFCEKEELPVDFVSTHPYPTDFALDGQSQMKGRTRKKDALKDDLVWLKDLIANSAYPNAETHLTEWSSSPSSRDCAHDFLPVASYIIKSNIDCTALTNSLSYWVFTDVFEEAGPGPTPYHGGFGMQTIKGIEKPSFHAYRMLNNLGSIEVSRGDEYIVTKNEDNKVAILAYNYADDEPRTPEISVYPSLETALKTQGKGEDKMISINLEGLNPNETVNLEVLDENNGSAVTDWIKMGCPDNLTRAQENELKISARALKKSAYKVDENGKLNLEITLPKWGVALLKSE